MKMVTNMKEFSQRIEVNKYDLLEKFGLCNYESLSFLETIEKIVDKISKDESKVAEASFKQFIETSVIDKNYLTSSRKKGSLLSKIPYIKVYTVSLLRFLIRDSWKVDEIIEELDKLELEEIDDVILTGIRAIFNEDYICSLFIFIPQIERFIREILEIRKISIISIKDKHAKTFRFAELGRLLELCEENNVLDSNLLEIIDYFLLDTGNNVRNDVAHGNIVADLNVKHNSLFSFLLSMFLIFIYFKERSDSNSV